jgi:hypothetical protein
MERTIRTLKEMRDKAERSFIDNSLIRRISLIDSPVPNTEADLDAIAELNEAISVLENYLMQKPKMANGG